MMRPQTLVSIAAAALLLAAAPAPPWSSNSENTLRLAEGAARPAASIADVSWLAGYWQGEGFDGTLEEIWSRPAGDRMQGIFTLAKEGKPVFSEAMQLVEEEGSLTLKVKHFTPEFVGWEEKDKYVRFQLVRLAENEAYFSGLTLRRSGDALTIYLVLSQAGERTEHEFKLTRVSLD